MFSFLSSRRRISRRALFTARAHLQVEALESRLVPYSVSGNAWPHPELITISFVPDGTDLGGKTSNLFATFNAKFGSAATWQSQILKAAQVWAQQTNINFALVADNGTATGSGNYQQGDPGFGDIRIGGFNFGNSTLAQAFMPPPVNNFSIAGDMQFNTGITWNIGSTYDLFTVASHEFGHALGLYHGTTGSMMQSAYPGTKTALAADDINGSRSIYSGNAARAKDSYDASAANETFSTATVITSLINTTTKTALAMNRDLSTATDVDFYKFTVPSGSSSTLKVTVQTTGLSLLAPKVDIYNSSQALVTSANGAGLYGTTLNLTVNGIAAGQTYYVKVSSADSFAASKTGLYGLSLSMGTGAAPVHPSPNTQTTKGAVTSGGGGQPVAEMAEFRINNTTTGIQQTSADSRRNIAMTQDGGYVVTWASSGQDGDGWGIYARRYDAAGVALGNEFRVNTTTLKDQTSPSVAIDALGNFVIAWAGQSQNGSGSDIYGRSYLASGLPSTGEFRVNTSTAGDQTSPTVAMDTILGGFAFVWTSSGQDGSGQGIYARRYDVLGLALLPEFRVNSTTVGDQIQASASIDTLRRLVVTWTSVGQDGSQGGIYGRRFDLSCISLGGEFRVNTTTSADQQFSSVCADTLGNFVVTWSSYGQDGSGWGIYGQRFNILGQAIGGEFAVNSTTAGDQHFSSVDTDASGNFIVTWTSSNQDGSGSGIFGQQYTYGGVAPGTEFKVNKTTSGDQQHASVAMDSNGHIVVVWSGNGSGDASGIFGQRFVMGWANEESVHAYDPLGNCHGHNHGPDHDHDCGCACSDCISSLSKVFSEEPEVLNDWRSSLSNLLQEDKSANQNSSPSPGDEGEHRPDLKIEFLEQEEDEHSASPGKSGREAAEVANASDSPGTDVLDVLFADLGIDPRRGLT